jgi:probable HAF family extracellular repeat protein
MKNVFLLTCFLAVISTAMAYAHAQKNQQPGHKYHHIHYRLTLLDPNYDPDSTNLAINNRGDVLIGSDFYRNGHKYTCTSADPSLPQVDARGMNDNGDVVGRIYKENDGAYLLVTSDVVVWRHGKMVSRHLKYNPDGCAINNAGEIAYVERPAMESKNTETNGDEAYFLSHNKSYDLGPGDPCSLNNKRQVVVNLYNNYTNTAEIFLWSSGHMKAIKIPKKFGRVQEIVGINDQGQIAGSISIGYTGKDYPNDELKRAFVWKNGIVKILGTLGKGSTEAFAMNNRGEIVGKSDVRDNAPHAILYGKSSLCDLNNLIPASKDFVLTSANAINDKGQIVCGSNKGVYLLTPDSIIRPPPQVN